MLTVVFLFIFMFNKSSPVNDVVCILYEGFVHCFIPVRYIFNSKLILLKPFEFGKGEPAHFQEQPAVAEAVDVGRAVGSGAVGHRHFNDLKILFDRAE
ncbi:hypothetical protein FJZ33_06320, partial [Candidatus Poribacteria bacterium]|nr:hypothetical protein [Candidatus Poribacteria bacterium]